MPLPLSCSPGETSLQAVAVGLEASPPEIPVADPAPSGVPVLRRPGPAGHTAPADDIVDEWGRQSFRASDLPANW